MGPGYKEEYIKEIEKVKTDNVDLIYTPASLKEYINKSKIVITAGGSTVYEVLSQRSIPIIFSLADNQDMICKTLKEYGVDYLGKYPDIQYNKLRKSMENLHENHKLFYGSIIKLDGHGVKIVIKEIRDYGIKGFK